VIGSGPPFIAGLESAITALNGEAKRHLTHCPATAVNKRRSGNLCLTKFEQRTVRHGVPDLRLLTVLTEEQFEDLLTGS